MSEDSRKYESFFNDFSDFKERVLKSKMRGNNSYNPLLVIRKSNEEVLLHSKMLHSFLNPHSNHYQDSIFLDKFLEMCVLQDSKDYKNLKEWFGETKHASVWRESDNIDIFITNNSRHIIIENKVWAGEQERQLERYIESIIGDLSQDSSEDSNEDSIENSDEKPNLDSAESKDICDNLAVIYLTLDGYNPSKYSTGIWDIKGDFLESNGKKILYKAISYKDDIIKWIESSQSKEAVGNITNLNFALECYKDAVKEITNQRKDNMAITNFLDSEEKYAVAWEFVNFGEENLKDTYLKKFVYGKCKEKKGETWEMVIDDSRFYHDGWRICVAIYNQKHFEQTFKFMFVRENKKGQQKIKDDFGIEMLIKKGDKSYFYTESCDEIADKIGEIIKKEFGDILDETCFWFNNEYYGYAKDINETIDLINKVNDFLATDSQIAALAKELENIK